MRSDLEFEIEVLEPRILLSADGLVAPVLDPSAVGGGSDAAASAFADTAESIEMAGEAANGDSAGEGGEEGLFDGLDDGETVAIEVAEAVPVAAVDPAAPTGSGAEPTAPAGAPFPLPGEEFGPLASRPADVEGAAVSTPDGQVWTRASTLEKVETLRSAQGPPDGGTGTDSAASATGPERIDLLQLVDRQPGFASDPSGDESGRAGLFLVSVRLIKPAGLDRDGNWSLAEAEGATVRVDAARPEAHLHVPGDVALAGRLMIDVDPALEPAVGDRFTVLTWGGERTGSFAGYVGVTGFGEGLYLVPEFGDGQLDFVVVHNADVPVVVQQQINQVLDEFERVLGLIEDYAEMAQEIAGIVGNLVDSTGNGIPDLAVPTSQLGDLASLAQTFADTLEAKVAMVLDEAVPRAQSAVTTALQSLDGTNVGGFELAVNNATLSGGTTLYFWNFDLTATRPLSGTFDSGSDAALGASLDASVTLEGSVSFRLATQFGKDALGVYLQVDTFEAALDVNASSINVGVSFGGPVTSVGVTVVDGTIDLDAQAVVTAGSRFYFADLSAINAGNVGGSFSITPTTSIAANLPLSTALSGLDFTASVNGTLTIDAPDLFGGAAPDLDLTFDGASLAIANEDVEGTFVVKYDDANSQTVIEATITRLELDADGTQFLAASGSGLFLIDGDGDVAGTALLTIDEGSGVGDVTFEGMFDLRFNTDTVSGVTSIGGTVVDLPVGPYFRIEGTGVSVAVGGSTGGSLSGDFLFEKQTVGPDTIVTVGAANLALSDGLASDLISLTVAEAGFVFEDDGFYGRALDAMLTVAVPGISNLTGTYSLRVNTTGSAKNRTVTIGGASQTVMVPEGPFFEITGSGVSLDVGAGGASYTLAADTFTFRQSEAGGIRTTTLSATGLATEITDGGGTPIVSLSGADGGFLFTADGIAGQVSGAAVAVENIPGLSGASLSGTFAFQVNNTPTETELAADLIGEASPVTLPAGSFLRVEGTGVELAFDFGGGVAPRISGNFSFQRQDVGGSEVIAVGATDVSFSLRDDADHAAATDSILTVTNGTGAFFLRSGAANGIAGSIGGTLTSDIADVVGITGTVAVAFNTFDSAVDETVTVGEASIAIDLPAGDFLRVTGEDLEIELQVAPGSTQVISGDFTFEQGADKALVGVSELALELQDGSGATIVEVSNGTGAFAFTDAGVYGQASATVSVTVPNVTLETSSLDVTFNTTPSVPGMEAITVGGSTVMIDIDAAGPYFRIEGEDVALTVNVLGAAQQVVAGSLAFELREVDGAQVATAAFTDLGIEFTDGSSTLLEVEGADGVFVFTDEGVYGFAGDAAVTTAPPNVSLSGTFAFEVNTTDAEATVDGSLIGASDKLLPAGPYLRLSATGLTATLTLGGGLGTQQLTGNFVFEKGVVDGGSVLKIGASDVTATLTAGGVSLELGGGQGAILVNADGPAGKFSIDSVTLAGVPGITGFVVRDLAVEFNATGADVAETTISTSDTGDSVTFEFADPYYHHYFAVAGTADIVTAFATLNGSFAFEKGTSTTLGSIFKIGVSDLSLELVAGSTPVISFRNGTGAFIASSAGLAGSAELDFETGLISVSGHIVLQVNTTGMAIGPESVDTGPSTSTMLDLDAGSYLKVCVEGNLQLGSFGLPVDFIVERLDIGMPAERILFKSKTGTDLLVYTEADGIGFPPGSPMDNVNFNDPSPAGIIALIRGLLDWFELFRRSEVFQIEIPFTDATIGDAVDWGKGFLDQVYSWLINVELRADQAIAPADFPVITLDEDITLAIGEQTFTLPFGSSPAGAVGSAGALAGALNSTIGGIDLDPDDPSLGTLDQWLEVAVDGDVPYFRMLQPGLANSTILRITEAADLVAAGFQDNAAGIEIPVADTVQGILDAIAARLGITPPTYDPLAHMILFEGVGFTADVSETIGFDFGEAFGPLGGVELDGEFEVAAELTFGFDLGLDWSPYEVPRLISSTSTPTPSNGVISENASFEIRLNETTWATVNLAAGNYGSVEGIADALNTAFGATPYTVGGTAGMLLDFIHAQKAGNSIAINAVVEEDQDGDGTVDPGDFKENKNGNATFENWLGVINKIELFSAIDDPIATEVGFAQVQTNAAKEIIDDSNADTESGTHYLSTSVVTKKGLFVDNVALSASIEITTTDTIDGGLQFGFIEINTSGGEIITGHPEIDGVQAASSAPITLEVALEHQSTGRTKFYLADLFGLLTSLGEYLDGPNFSGAFYASLKNLEARAGFYLPLGDNPELSIYIPDINHLDYNSEPYHPVDNNEGIFITTPDLDELGDLFNFDDFGFAEIVDALDKLVELLSGLEGFGFLDEEIPVINLSISDLVDYARQVADLLDAIQEDPAGALQALVDEISGFLETELGLADENYSLTFENTAVAQKLSGQNKVSAIINPQGSDNALEFSSTDPQWDEAIIALIEDASLAMAVAAPTWNASEKRLLVRYNPSMSPTANDLIAQFPGGTPWTVSTVASDGTGYAPNDGTGELEFIRALKFQLRFNVGYANDMPLQLDLAQLLADAGNGSALDALLNGIGDFVQLEGSGAISVAATASLNVELGLDLEDFSNIRPFIYDTTGVELTASFRGTDIQVKAALGALGVFIDEGTVTFDADGNPNTEDAASFTAGFKDKADDRYYFDGSLLSLDNVDLRVEAGLNAALPLFAPLETNPVGSTDDENGDGYPDNQLVIDIPDFMRFFTDERSLGDTAVVRVPGANNDLEIVRTTAEEFTVAIDDTGSAGAAFAGDTLTLSIDAGVTTASQVKSEVDGLPGFSASFIADTVEDDPLGNDGSGVWTDKKIDFIVPDFSSLLENLDLCTVIDQNAVLLLDGLDGLLGVIEGGLDTLAFDGDLPLIGDGFSGAASFIADFREGLLADIRTALDEAGGVSDLIENLIKDAFWNTLGPDGIDILVDPDTGEEFDVSLGSGQLDITVDCEDGLVANLRLKKVLDLVDTTDNPLDFDIGVPGFGLDVEGNVVIELGFDLKLRFGLNGDDGFWVGTAGGHDWKDLDGDGVQDANETGTGDPELKIFFRITIPDTSLTGELFFLQLEIKDGHEGQADSESRFEGFFSVDLKDPNNDGKLTFPELTGSGVEIGDILDPKLAAVAEINLDLIASFGGNAAFPRLLADFDLDWEWNLEDGAGDPHISFGNVRLDLGSFVSDFLRPILDEIQKITKPIQPIIDVVTARLPILSDLAGEDITLLTLAELFGYLDPGTVRFIENVIAVIEIINNIPEGEGSIYIPFGSFNLGADENGDMMEIDVLDDLDSIDLDSILDSPGEGSTASMTQISDTQDFVDSLDNTDNFSFPFIQEPATLFNLFLGEPVSLVEWRMPTFNFEFSYSQSIPLYPPLYVEFGGKIGAKIDIGFGYDTYGIQKFIDSEDRNWVDILDGFYVIDFDEDGNERPELTLIGQIWAGAELNLGIAEFGVRGGVELTVEFDLNDVVPDGKVRISEIVTNALIDPRCIFNIHGEVSLFLEAYLKIDLFFFSIDKTWRFGEFVLFEFDVTCPQPVLASVNDATGELTLHMGGSAGAREEIDTADNQEHFVVTQTGGNASDGFTVMVSWNGYEQEYEGVKSLTADGGAQDDIIDLRGTTFEILSVTGGDGNDEILLGDGNGAAASPVHVDGGDGDDVITAGAGTGLVIHGGEGRDTLTAGTAAITIDGGGGADTITGSAFDDTLHGGAGADVIVAGAGNDTVTGGTGNDDIRAGDGDDVVTAGAGNDTVRGGKGDDELRGDDPADLAATGDDFLLGELGDDRLIGGPGDDRLYGQAGIDVILGDSGTIVSVDEVLGLTGEGDDYIVGGGGGDVLFGGDGDDFIYGGTLFVTGESEVFEEDGNDFIDGGRGDDQIFGDDAFGRTGERNTGIFVDSKVFFDDNGNGLFDEGEGGFGGIEVRIYEAIASLPLAGTTVTKSDGSFRLGGLKPKEYRLEFVLPSSAAGFVDFATQDANGNGDDDRDSDVITNVADPWFGFTEPFLLPDFGTVTDVAAGFVGDAVIRIGDVGTEEGNLGQRTASFTVTMTRPLSDRVTFTYRTIDDTATGSGAHADFAGVTSRTVTLEPGELTRTIPIPINGDSVYEKTVGGYETFTLRLQSLESDGPVMFDGGGATLDATGLIFEDDSIPGLAISDFLPDEGGTTMDGSISVAPDPENAPATFTISLSRPSQTTITVFYSTQRATDPDGNLAGDAATPTVDYEPVAPTMVTFLPYETEKEVVITTYDETDLGDDPLDEPDEAFHVVLSNPAGAELSDPRGVGVIQDDDDPVEVTIVGQLSGTETEFVTEGDDGNKTVTFEVILSAKSGKTVTVTWSTARGSAFPNFSAGGADPEDDLGDYLSESTTEDLDDANPANVLVFEPGETMKTIDVSVVGDTVDEDTEFFFVNLLQADGAEIVENHGIVEIGDDDTGPSNATGPFNIVFSNTVYSAAEGETARITLQRSHLDSYPAVVLTLTPGTAELNDYESSPHRHLVLFGDDQYYAQVDIALTADEFYEGDETVLLDLRLPTGQPVPLDPGNAVLVIEETTSFPEIRVLEDNFTEGDADSAENVWVYSNVLIENDIDFDYEFIDLTAGATDYTPVVVAGTATIVGGGFLPIALLPFTLEGDLAPEVGESFGVRLSNPVNAVIPFGFDLGVLEIADNDPTEVEGRIFEDADGDGYKDPDEGWLSGVTVTIEDSAGNAPSDASDASGIYKVNVVLGELRLTVDETTVPAGYELTTANDNQTVEYAGSGISPFGLIGYRAPDEVVLPEDSEDTGTGFTDDSLYGGPQDDEIFGGGGFDRIVGGHWQTAVNVNEPINQGSYDARLALVENEWDLNNEIRVVDETFLGNPADIAGISGVVWDDLDGDGRRDVGEPGIAGVVVHLLDSSYNRLFSKVTGGTGTYSFVGFPAGGYLVEVEPPEGTTFTTQAAGGVPANLNSDFNPASRQTAALALAAGGVTTAQSDAGLLSDPSLGNNPGTGVYEFQKPSYAVLQPASGETDTVAVTVTRNSSFEPGAVLYFATGATAVDGVHFLATQGFLLFDVGETQKTFEVSILDGAIPAGDAVTILLSLREPTGRPLTSKSVIQIVGPGSANLTDDDHIEGEDDDDYILGDSGYFTDGARITSGDLAPANVVLMGGLGLDEIHGGAGDDWIHAQLGDDVIAPNEGTNTTQAGFGDDVVTVQIDDQIVRGDAGEDTIQAFEDGDYALSNALLVLDSRYNGRDVTSHFTLDSFETALLVAGYLDNRFVLTDWTGEATVDGRGGTDTIEVVNDLDMTLNDHALALSNGSTYHLISIEQAVLQGGGASNIIDASAYSLGGVTFVASPGNDTLVGTDQDDTFVYLVDTTDLDADSLTGNGGTDTVAFSHDGAATAHPVVLDLSLLGILQTGVVNNGAIDLLDLTIAAEDIEVVIGGSNDDTLTGNGLANRLIGNLGDDTIAGRGGNDVYVYDADAPWGVDTLIEWAGEGADTLDFSDTTSQGIVLNLGVAGLQQPTGQADRGLVIGGDADFDTVIGTAFADMITGSAGANTLRGGLGNDTLVGGAGNDFLDGGEGDDSLDGGEGDDAVWGIADSDFVLSSGSLVWNGEIDTLASIEVALLTGGVSANEFEIVAFPGEVVVIGGAFQDTLRVSYNSDMTLADIGPNAARLDLDIGGATHSYFIFGVEIIELTGGVDDNVIDAGGYTLGDLVINGGNGDDTLIGGSGNDILRGGYGDDTLTGDPVNPPDDEGGSDLLDGGEGIDTFTETRDVDYRIHSGNVVVGSEFDTLMGIENVTLTGGAAGNTFTVFSWDSGVLTLDGGGGFDGVWADRDTDLTADGSTLVLADSPGGTILHSGFESAALWGGAGDNTLDASAFPGPVALVGRGGDDVLIGGVGNDLLVGDGLVAAPDDGDDTYLFDADSPLGSDNLADTGGTGDRIDYAATTSQTVELDLSLVTTQTVNANHKLRILSIGRVEHVTGGDLDDVLTGTSGNNTLVGGPGVDQLFGMAGNDTLEGGPDKDLLDGGDDNDTYLFDADAPGFGDDSLVDSGGSADLLDFSATTTTGVTVDLSIAGVQPVAAGSTLDLATGMEIERIVGGDGGDTLTGNAANNQITGGRGDDTLDGAGGANTYFEQRDADFVITDGAVAIDDGGPAELDAIANFAAIFLFLGDAGHLVDAGALTTARLGIAGGAGNDTILGGSLDDIVNGGAGDDEIHGGGGDDLLTGAEGDDTLLGEAGDDTYAFFVLTTNFGTDTVIEQPGEGANDTLNLGGAAVPDLTQSTPQFLGPNLTLVLPNLNVETVL